MLLQYELKNESRTANTVYEIIAAYRQATLHILCVVAHYEETAKNNINSSRNSIWNLYSTWTNRYAENV